MLRATIHTPDLITNLTFPDNSPQYQHLIVTLDTPLLLTIPPSNSRRSWDIIYDVESHHSTFQLMLATITLQRYHQVWYTILDTWQYIATPLHTPQSLNILVQ